MQSLFKSSQFFPFLMLHAVLYFMSRFYVLQLKAYVVILTFMRSEKYETNQVKLTQRSILIICVTSLKM